MHEQMRKHLDNIKEHRENKLDVLKTIRTRKGLKQTKIRDKIRQKCDIFFISKINIFQNQYEFRIFFGIIIIINSWFPV